MNSKQSPEKDSKGCNQKCTHSGRGQHVFKVFFLLQQVLTFDPITKVPTHICLTRVVSTLCQVTVMWMCVGFMKCGTQNHTLVADELCYLYFFSLNNITVLNNDSRSRQASLWIDLSNSGNLS